MTSPRQIFVTTALPYANGAFHIGHIMEYIEADIWVRNLRMAGHRLHFVCADDAHGAPIMIAAQKAGLSPEAFIAPVQASRAQYLQGFHLSFDHWHSTHSPENTRWSQRIYRTLKAAGLIDVRDVEQFFDPEAKMFLPDRFIKGNCPKCQAPDQYGDACERCGAVYNPTELGTPRSVLSGAEPVLRTSQHFFFRLSDPRCRDFLRSWTQDGRLQPEVANKVKEWLGEDGVLADWDISRDAPYFGIEIPDAPGKYFYVWLDAPIGYIAALEACFHKHSQKDVESFLQDEATEQYHFIGKDIVYFHTLFWPAMLRFSGLKPPSNVFVHGFITIAGEKMSKSRGTGISPLRYLELGLDAEWLRYYLATKLSGRAEDIEFGAEDFVARINSDLVGKYINLASRASGFLQQHCGGTVGAMDTTLITTLKTAAPEIRTAYEARRYGHALREVMRLADLLNQFFDSEKPWLLAKSLETRPEERTKLHLICSTMLEGFRLLTLMLKPVLPITAEKVEAWFGLKPLSWSDVESCLVGPVAPYQHLMARVDEKKLSRLFNPEEPTTTPTTTPSTTKPTSTTATSNAPPGGNSIGIEDFARVDMRVAKVLGCEAVIGSTKLLKFTLELGEKETRTVFSGIAAHYPEPAALVGRLVIVVANLAPRQMRFGLSQGMILSASGSDDGTGVFLLSTDSKAQPGMRVS